MKSRYEREWTRWETWALSHDYPPMPAEVAHLAEYAMGLLVLGASAPGVGMVLSSIRWRHQDADTEPPPDDEQIPATLEAPGEVEPLTVADAAELIEVTSRRRSYRVGRGVRLERPSRTTKRAALDSVIIGLVWETLATAAEIAALEWSHVDLAGRTVRYQDREGWSPVSVGLAHRLTLLADMRSATTHVIGLSPASVRRRVKEAADYGGSRVWMVAAAAPDQRGSSPRLTRGIHGRPDPGRPVTDSARGARERVGPRSPCAGIAGTGARLIPGEWFGRLPIAVPISPPRPPFPSPAAGDAPIWIDEG